VDALAPPTETATSSTDSGQGSEPLSDAFVAVPAGKGSRIGPNQRVEAPEGSSQMFVRRSARVASSRSRSVRADTSMSVPSGQVAVVAQSGGMLGTGQVYRVLHPVVEETGQIGGLTGPTGNAGGLRDLATPQLGSTVGSSVLAGRKCSASSAAPGSGRRGPFPKHLASAADLPPLTSMNPLAMDPFR
jgi:hypothetical protein